MSRWNDPYKENQRAWERFKSSLSDIRRALVEYSYDPNESKINDTYDLDQYKGYSYYKYSINVLVFLLPKSFVTHSVNELLTPLIPPELPKLPALPPLEPTSVPDWYQKREKRDFYFKDEKWVEKAKQKLEPINFNNQFLSFLESDIISNLVLIDESTELESKIEDVRRAGLQTHREALEKLLRLAK